MLPPVAVSAKLMVMAVLLPRWSIAQPLKPLGNASLGRYKTTKNTGAEKANLEWAPPHASKGRHNLSVIAKPAIASRLNASMDRAIVVQISIIISYQLSVVSIYMWESGDSYHIW